MATRLAKEAGKIAKTITNNDWEYGQEFEVVELPCPDCGQYIVKGWSMNDHQGKHQHTIYVCTGCDWEGWFVPDPDD